MTTPPLPPGWVDLLTGTLDTVVVIGVGTGELCLYAATYGFPVVAIERYTVYVEYLMQSIRQNSLESEITLYQNDMKTDFLSWPTIIQPDKAIRLLYINTGGGEGLVLAANRDLFCNNTIEYVLIDSSEPCLQGDSAAFLRKAGYTRVASREGILYKKTKPCMSVCLD
jgi:tRNA G46 methylase TrmB